MQDHFVTVDWSLFQQMNPIRIEIVGFVDQVQYKFRLIGSFASNLIKARKGSKIRRICKQMSRNAINFEAFEQSVLVRLTEKANSQNHSNIHKGIPTNSSEGVWAIFWSKAYTQ